MNKKIQDPDFSKYNPIFDNTYEKVGPEFGELQQKKEDFLKQNASKYVIEPDVPKNIAGLINRTAAQRRIPSTMRWFRQTTSFERNGAFNVQTHVYNTRFLSVFFFVFLGWGWSAFQAASYQTVVQSDSHESRTTVYDKLSMREIPPSKLWTRPG